MREWPPVRQRRRAGAASAHLTARPPLTPRGENCACVQGIGFIQLASPTTEGLGWHSPLPPSSRKRSRSSPEIWAQVSAAGRYLQQEGAGGEEVAFPNPYFAYLRPAAIPVFPQTPELNFLRDASCVTVTIGHLSATPRLPSRWHHTLARAVCVCVCGALMLVATKCIPALVIAPEAKRADISSLLGKCFEEDGSPVTRHSSSADA